VPYRSWSTATASPQCPVGSGGCIPSHFALAVRRDRLPPDHGGSRARTRGTGGHAHRSRRRSAVMPRASCSRAAASPRTSAVATPADVVEKNSCRSGVS
jgi:hypothetical protein